MRGGRLKVRRRRANVLVRCLSHPSGTCRGSVQLRRKRGRRFQALGSARYSVRAGARKRVAVPLNRTALKLLRANRSVRGFARVTVRGGSPVQVKAVLVR